MTSESVGVAEMKTLSLAPNSLEGAKRESADDSPKGGGFRTEGHVPRRNRNCKWREPDDLQSRGQCYSLNGVGRWAASNQKAAGKQGPQERTSEAEDVGKYQSEKKS